MPYKVGLRDGGEMGNGRYYLSNKPLPRSRALAQKAVEMKRRTKISNFTRPHRRTTENVRIGIYICYRGTAFRTTAVSSHWKHRLKGLYH